MTSRVVRVVTPLGEVVVVVVVNRCRLCEIQARL
jgi:hypothetical protein